jgi:peptidoglycan/LPS O-acetylase OafA/YrhL
MDGAITGRLRNELQTSYGVGTMTVPSLRLTKSSALIVEFDGMRGLAVLGVVLFHSQAQLVSLHLDGIVRYGWIGVNLFFVLSGFLITGILIRSKPNPNFFKNFYVRRALRIWPLYFALLFFSWAIAHAVPGKLSEQLLHTRWLVFILFLQNVCSISMPGPLVPTWTLAIEEHFYSFWAPIVRLASMRSLMFLLCFVIAASPVARYGLDRRILAANTLLNLDGLAFGALLALLFRPERRLLWSYIAFATSIIGVVGISLCRFQATNALLSSWLACLFSGLVTFALLSAHTNSLYGRILRIRWLRYLGNISYGLYLLHGWAAVFVSSAGVDRRLVRFGAAGDLATVAIRFVVSVLFATGSWYLLEQPILRFKKRFGGTEAFQFSAGGSLAPISITRWLLPIWLIRLTTICRVATSTNKPTPSQRP